MAPTVAQADLALSYPIYSCDFDPQNSNFLFVGGGGGEGRSGVKNKITLIDTSRKQQITELVDIELSSEEDSVSSLAVAQSEATSAVVYAGINSSLAEQEKGNNEHLRSFMLQYPLPKADKTASTENGAVGAKTEALRRISLFTPSTATKKETYQRVLRLSRFNKKRETRLGAIASGLAPVNEVIAFDASQPKPSESDVRQRIQLENGEEAADVDIIEANEYEHYMAYCTDYEIYVCKIPFDKSASPRAPSYLYGTPFPDTFSSKRRPVFRFLRFLTPRLLVVLLNLPGRTGVELYLLQITENPMTGTIILRKSMHKGIKAATAFAMALLPSPNVSQNLQHAIAIAGQDISLTILTVDHDPSNHRSLSFQRHSFHKEVHPMQMTSLAFSTFIPPEDPIKALPQYLKLASTSMNSTVAVHTIPLIPFPSPVAKKRPGDPPTRYTIQNPGSRNEQAQMGLSVIFAVIMVAIGAFLLQAYTEIRGMSPDILGAKGWLSQSLHDKLALPYMFADQHPVMVDSLPPIESGARTAYEVVKDSIPTDTEELHQATTNVAKKIKHTAHRSHRKLRDLLHRRKDFLETEYDEADDESEEEGDYAEMPLFASVFGEEYTRPASTGSSGESDTRAIVIRDGSHDGHGLSTELHQSEEDLVQEGKARKWDDLNENEKRGWRKKLQKAGVWALEESDTVLKGIFFSELGGVVADAIRG